MGKHQICPCVIVAAARVLLGPLYRGMEQLSKHDRYKHSYRPGDVYWGIGIENETYIELSGKAQTTAEFIQKNQKRERYSVDYWTQYKMPYVNNAIQSWINTLPEDKHTSIKLPLLLNGHSLAKCDRHGEHQTTYAKIPKPNPAFCGTTLLEDLAKINPVIFLEGRDVWWTLDGDTVEFMTQNYYCAKMEDVIEELLESKQKWITALGNGLEQLQDREQALKHSVKYPEKNHGFAVFLTNRKNVAIFNNGTYHFNLTLPTYLDKDARIANMDMFLETHRSVARLFQWLSPFLLAQYGSGDILSKLSSLQAGNSEPQGGDCFPAGSQRLCASRFVSVGTYDTEKMAPGKILTMPYVRCEDRWYEKIYDLGACAYNVLPAIGLDINYNKHWNHGLEFRIFDWFPESLIPHVMRMLIWMCDEGLLAESVVDPRHDDTWNTVLARCVWNGRSAMLSAKECIQFGSILHVPDLRGPISVSDAYDHIWNTWRDRWDLSTGTCTSYMIRNSLTPRPIQPIPCQPVEHIADPIIEHVAALPVVITQIPIRDQKETSVRDASVQTVPISKKPWYCCFA